MAVDFKIIGERLKEARKKKGFTQEDLVEKMEVSVAYLSKVERGKIHINLERLSQICHLLDITEGEILNGVYKNSPQYLNSEFSILLKQCSVKQQKLAYRIIKSIIEIDI